MDVAKILRTKGHRVVTVPASAPVAEAVRLLAERNCGAVVALDEQDIVVGILSERDVVQALAKHGSDILSDPVSTIMTADPLTCTRDGAVSDLLQMMMGWNIRHLPVVENRILLGLVSMGDLVKSTLDRDLFDTTIPGHLAMQEEDSADGTSL